MDPSGNFRKFKDFVKMNYEMCKWIGISVVCVQVSFYLFSSSSSLLTHVDTPMQRVSKGAEA